MPSVKEVEIDLDVLSVIARSYSTLQFSPELIDHLTYCNSEKDYSCHSKLDLHRELNDILLNNYSGEFFFKYALFTEFLNKSIVGGFEMKVANSRTDFVAINGSTTSFEIKSERDNLTKLERQSKDYMSIFEYNYAVVDKKHLAKVITVLPENYGIWTYNGKKKKVYRKSGLSDMINPSSQLAVINKKELVDNFGYEDKQLVLENFDASTINKRFKVALKARYKKRWDFIVNNYNSILPIDLQFFFNSNISPEIIYTSC